MSINNEILIEGNYNTILQGVSARDISITISDNLPADVKLKKQELKYKIEDLALKFEQKLELLPASNIFEPEEIDPELLMLATSIDAGKCVLFIGPEISIGENEKSLHDEFYIEKANQMPDAIVYNQKEGLFQLTNEFYFHALANRFYTKDFSSKNKYGRAILEKLASLPFKFSIVFSPDNTLKDIYEYYDFPHNFLFYKDGYIDDQNLDSEKTNVVNVLGSAVSNQGQFIYTYNDVYNYIKNTNIPPDIKMGIKTASHYLFVGFDFNKWNIRLLMYVLGINENSKNDGRLIEQQTAKEIEEFIAKQFNIKVVKKDYMQFADSLLSHSKIFNSDVNLLQFMYKHQIFKLKNLSNIVTDENLMVQLHEVEKMLTEISKKLEL